jgi:hypothetical protein
MSSYFRFRQVKFSEIEMLSQSLKSSVKELENLEKDKNSLLLKTEALMIGQLVKNALSSVKHLVRVDLDNEKAINLLKVVVNYLHAAYIRVYKYGSYIAEKLKTLWQEAFNILPLGMAVQPELFAPNEIVTPRENKLPILSTIAKWLQGNTQQWAFETQNKLSKKHSVNPQLGIQLCLDLESVTSIRANEPLQNSEKECLQNDSYQGAETPNLLSIEDIKNLTLRAARKLAGELGLAQKVNGRDLRKDALIASLLDWRQQQVCTAF